MPPKLEKLQWGKPADTWRTESRALFKLAGPLILTGFAEVALSTTDVIMIGWLGSGALAAGTLGSHYYGFFYFLGMGVLFAVSPVLAQALGAHRRRAVRPTVQQGMILALIIGVPGCAIVWNGSTVLAALGQDPLLTDAAGGYLRAHLWGYPAALLAVVLTQLLASHSRPRATLVATVFAIGINAIANYALMFGNFGFPRLELVGAGISSAFVEWPYLIAFLFASRPAIMGDVLGIVYRAIARKFTLSFPYPVVCLIMSFMVQKNLSLMFRIRQRLTS